MGHCCCPPGVCGGGGRVRDWGSQDGGGGQEPTAVLNQYCEQGSVGTAAGLACVRCGMSPAQSLASE